MVRNLAWLLEAHEVEYKAAAPAHRVAAAAADPEEARLVDHGLVSAAPCARHADGSCQTVAAEVAIRVGACWPCQFQKTFSHTRSAAESSISILH